VDTLRRDSVELARRTPPGERARQALDLMQAGFRLKLAGLRTRHPAETEEQIQHRFRLWLDGDDRA
jgi:hypothetical protein